MPEYGYAPGIRAPLRILLGQGITSSQHGAGKVLWHSSIASSTPSSITTPAFLGDRFTGDEHFPFEACSWRASARNLFALGLMTAFPNDGEWRNCSDDGWMGLTTPPNVLRLTTTGK